MRAPLVLALALLAASASAQPDTGGTWEGLARMPGQTLAMTVTLSPGSGGWAGTVDVPEAGMRGVPFSSVEVTDDSLRLELPGGLAALTGRFSAGGALVAGEVRYGTQAGTFTLARPGSPEATALAGELAAWTIPPSPHPDSARVVTEDVARFWAAYDASTPETRAAALQRDYLDRASPGLEDFHAIKIGTAEQLAGAVNAYPRYYASARAATLGLGESEPAIRAAFRQMEVLYPDAVYLVVGRMTSGGTISPRGLLLGAEMFGRTAETPEDELSDWHRDVISPAEVVAPMVAHELIHYQQDYADPGHTLLSRALREGSADYLGERVSGGNINSHVHAWADPREESVWCEFQAAMDGTDTSAWLYSGSRTADRPADVGYYVGYKIAEAFYEQARAAGLDDGAAVHAILHINDARAFLEESGYAERFTCDE